MDTKEPELCEECEYEEVCVRCGVSAGERWVIESWQQTRRRQATHKEAG